MLKSLKINLSGESSSSQIQPGPSLILNLKIRCLSLKLRFSPVEIGLGKRYPTVLSISWSNRGQNFPLISDKWVALHNFWARFVQYRVSLWYHTYCNLDNTCTNTWAGHQKCTTPQISHMSRMHHTNASHTHQRMHHNTLRHRCVRSVQKHNSVSQIFRQITWICNGNYWLNLANPKPSKCPWMTTTAPPPFPPHRAQKCHYRGRLVACSRVLL